MPYLRFQCSGRINKPLPQALVSALPAIKDNVATLKTYARKLNEGKPNEEQTNVAVWGNETGYIWWNILLAAPMPIPQALSDRLPAIKARMRKLKDWAVQEGEGAWQATSHTCYHDVEGNHPPCEPKDL